MACKHEWDSILVVTFDPVNKSDSLADHTAKSMFQYCLNCLETRWTKVEVKEESPEP